jgi:hypothetical protein
MKLQMFRRARFCARTTSGGWVGSVLAFPVCPFGREVLAGLPAVGTALQAVQKCRSENSFGVCAFGKFPVVFLKSFTFDAAKGLFQAAFAGFVFAGVRLNRKSQLFCCVIRLMPF